MTEQLLEREPVRRVRAALKAAGSAAEVIVLADTARTAEDAARALGCELGAIVKSLVFRSGEQAVMALVAGDRQCDLKALRDELGLSGKPKQAEPDFVREATGFTIGGVAPLGHTTEIPVVADASLGRFEKIFAAAGHPHCVFPTTLQELAGAAGAAVSEKIAG
ncbi:MAG: YbaK/EbsC family protein [Minwuia sp.]|uniref:YbaK/EbsC family protein n=1 Tax=Minwuia sp. TaxID=2493630 RepID=UPI003A860A03